MKSVAAALVATAVASAAGAQTTQSTRIPAAGHYAMVNGINLYYEIHGSGRPVVLLHGGLGAIEMFGPNLPALARGHQVIAVDLQGHGRTADVDRPLSIQTMADDIAALLGALRIARPDVVGYSLGGGVAFQLAIRHPEAVGRLVLVSTPLRRDAFYADILRQQEQVGPQAAEMLRQTPMHEMYARLAPRPQDFPRLLGKLGEYMKRDFDYTADVARIQATTLIVAGDADIFPPSHAVEVFGLLGGGQRDAGWDGAGKGRHRLAILPGVTHYTMGADPALAAVVNAFLDDQANR